jgi:hypothetical protein
MSDKPALRHKGKPDYISKEICIDNFIKNFGSKNIVIIADSLGEHSEKILKKYAENDIFYENVQYGSGSSTFLHALNKALYHDDEDVIYFVEDDFLHLPGARKLIVEVFNETNADYVTLYDHPDKYIDRKNGGPNPFIKNGGEKGRVLLTSTSHWKETNSTVMTFASRVKTLREDLRVWKKCARKSYTSSFRAFIRLRKLRIHKLNIFQKKRILLSALPGKATHGEIEYLSPLVDWHIVASR